MWWTLGILGFVLLEAELASLPRNNRGSLEFQRLEAAKWRVWTRAIGWGLIFFALFGATLDWVTS